MADASFTVDAKLDTKGFMSNSKELLKAIKSFQSSTMKASREIEASATGYFDALERNIDASKTFDAQMQELENKAAKLRAQLREMASTEIKTDSYKKLETSVTKAQQALTRLYEREQKMITLGTDLTRPAQQIVEQIERAGGQVDSANAKVEQSKRVIKDLENMLAAGINQETGLALTAKEFRDATQDLFNERKDLRDYTVELTNVQGRYDALLRQQRQMQDAGQWYTGGFRSLQYDIEQSEAALEKLESKQTEILMNNDDFVVGKNAEGFKEARDRLKDVNEQLQAAREMRTEAFGELPVNGLHRFAMEANMAFKDCMVSIREFGKEAVQVVTRVVTVLSQIVQWAAKAAFSLAKMVGGATLDALKRLAARAREAAMALARMVGNAFSSGMRKLTDGAKTLALHAGNAAKALFGLGRSAKKSNGNIGASFKTILKYVFGVRSMFFLVKRLRGAITDALGNMAKIDKPTNKALSSMTSALNQVKNSLGTAFQPLVTAVAPYITQFLNLLSAAITKVAEFFALLTGQNYILQATAYQTDYAKSLDKTKSASKAATKEIKNQLAAFDQLNILSAPGDSGSSGGGGSGTTEVDPSKLFKRVPLTSLVSDFIRDLKAAFNSGDFFGVGTIIAGKLNEVFENVKNLISWESVGDKITEFVTAVTSIFNGLTDPEKGINFGLIGETLGTGINTITQTLNTIFDKINWMNIRLALVSGINGLFREIKWEFIADLFTKRLNTIVDVLYDLFTKVKWGQIAFDLVHAFNEHVTRGIKWDKLGDMLGAAASTAIDVLVTALSTFDWIAAANGLTDTLNRFVAKVLRNITANKVNFIDIADKITAALNKMIEKVEWGNIGSLAAALMGTPLAMIRRVVTKFEFGEAGDKFAEAVNAFFSNEQMFKDFGATIDTSIKGFLDFGKHFLETFDEKQAALDIKTALGEIKWGEIASKVWEDAKLAFSKLGSFVNTLFSDQPIDAERYETHQVSAKELIKMRQNKGEDKSIAYTIGKKISDAIGTINWKDFGTTLSSGVTKLFNALKDFFQGLSEDGTLQKAVDDFFGGINWQTTTDAIWNAAYEFFKTLGGLLLDAVWQGIKGALGGLTTNFINAIGEKLGLTAQQSEAAMKQAYLLNLERFGTDAELAKATEDAAQSVTTKLVDSFEKSSEAAQEPTREAIAGLFTVIWDDLNKRSDGHGREIAGAYYRGLLDVMTENGKVKEEYRGIIEDMFGSVETFESGGMEAEEFLRGLVKGMLDGSTTSSPEIAAIFDALLAPENMGFESDGQGGGKYYMKGFGKGAQDEVSATQEKVGGAVNDVVEYVEGKQVLDQGSPSKRAQKSGQYYMQGFGAGVESEENATKATFDSVFGGVLDVAYHFSVMDAAVISGMLAIRESFTRSFNLINNDVTGYFTTMRTTTTTAMTALRVSITSSLNLITSSITTAVSTIDNRVRNGFNSINNSITNNLYSARSSAERINWAPVGDGIIDGIARGINNGWNWLNKTVWNLANALYRSARNALGIHSPSKLFADGVGKMIGLGIGEGLEDSEPQVLNAAMGVADAIADGMMIGETEMEMDVSGNGLLDGLNNVLTTFSGTVSTSFAELVAELNNIANSSSFRVPIVATGTILPYSVTGTATGDSTTVTQAIEASNDDLASVVMQAVNNATSAIVAAIQRSGTYGSTDKQSIDSIIDEINRRTLAQGKSPLLI